MRIASLVMLVVIVTLLAPLPLIAQEADPTAYMRIVHLSPDAPSVDIYIDDTLSEVQNISYTSASQWVALPAGRHELTLVPTGGGLERAPFPPNRLRFAVDSWTTVTVIGSLENQTIRFDTFTQDMTAVSFGGSRLVFYHAIEDGSSVNVIRDGVTFVPALAYGIDSALLTNAGTYNFQFVRSGDLSFELATLPMQALEPSYYYLIALVGSSQENTQAVVIPTDYAEVRIALGELEAPGTVVEAVASDPRSTEFRRAIEVANLSELLADPERQFTIFAPTEIALDDFVMTDTIAIEELVKYHIVEGELIGSDLQGGMTLTTLQGETLRVRFRDGRLYIEGSRLVETDIPAVNGVVHLIDNVLLPPETAE